MPQNIIPAGTVVPHPRSWEELLFLGESTLRQLVRLLRKEEDRIKNQIRKASPPDRSDLARERRGIGSKIGQLIALAKQAEQKPVLPKLRPMDYFTTNDPVVVYVADWPSGGNQGHRVGRYDWVRGTSLGPPSHIGTRYTIECSLVVHDKPEFLGGRGMSLSVVDPRLMFEWEFEYLRDHPDFARLWARNVEHYAPTPQNMLKLLREEPLVAAEARKR